jgi:hypothetical protein
VSLRPIEPMLATLARELPSGDEWLYEVKWDGYRTLILKRLACAAPLAQCEARHHALADARPRHAAELTARPEGSNQSRGVVMGDSLLIGRGTWPS